MNMQSSALSDGISTANPKQLKFFKANNRFVAYGGARGGGKSWALQRKITMLCMWYSGIKILLLRRTYPELQENHINTLSALLKGVAEYKATEKTFIFVNGSRIKCGYCKAESDVLQYQGQGHEWVKRLFISKRYKPSEKPEDYAFVPATVFDNTVLLEKDPGYVNMLNNLSDGLREAWRDGNWDMLAGQYFSEFDRSVHVIEPFEIPEHWRRYRTIDYGLDCLACLWAAVDELGNIYIYREYAEADKIISVGGADIVNLSQGEKIMYTVAPSDLWARSQESAKTKADLFYEAGLPLIEGSRDRETGWLGIKNLLHITETDSGRESRLKIFSNCSELIECLPALQRDSKKPTDCMTEPHNITHLPDALRYFVLQYITPSRAPQKKTELQKYRDKRLGGFNNARKIY